jgi:hypothetical protein
MNMMGGNTGPMGGMNMMGVNQGPPGGMNMMILLENGFNLYNI